MNIIRPLYLLALVVISSLFTMCNKSEVLEEVVYDTYFWAVTNDETRNVNLFINEEDKGSLYNSFTEIQCDDNDPLLGQLINLQLGNGEYKIKAIDQNGEVMTSSHLEIRNDGTSLSIDIRGADVDGSRNSECMSIKLFNK